MFRKLFFWDSDLNKPLGTTSNQPILKASILSELCKAIPPAPYSNFIRAGTNIKNGKQESPKAQRKSSDNETPQSVPFPAVSDKDDIIQDLKRKLDEYKDDFAILKIKKASLLLRKPKG